MLEESVDGDNASKAKCASSQITCVVNLNYTIASVVNKVLLVGNIDGVFTLLRFFTLAN
jgi:hypothetical protein